MQSQKGSISLVFVMRRYWETRDECWKTIRSEWDIEVQGEVGDRGEQIWTSRLVHQQKLPLWIQYGENREFM